MDLMFDIACTEKYSCSIIMAMWDYIKAKRSCVPIAQESLQPLYEHTTIC